MCITNAHKKFLISRGYLNISPTKNIPLYGTYNTYRPSQPEGRNDVPAVDAVPQVHRRLHTNGVVILGQPPFRSVPFVVTFEPQPSRIADAVVESEYEIEPTADDKAHQGETQHLHKHIHGGIYTKVRA